MIECRALLLYARAHHLAVYVLGTLIAVAAFCLALQASVTLGNLDGTATTPVSAAVVMIFGVLAGSTWTSRAEQQDRLLTRIPFLVRALHPPVVVLLSSVICAVTALLSLGQMSLGLPYLRTAILWSGMGLASAVMMRGAFAWVLPIAYLLVLANVGYDEASSPRWWNIPFRPPDDLAAWLISVGIAGCACCFAIAVPYRRRT